MAIALTANTPNDTSGGTRSDDQLMAAYARSDRRAFDELYARYREPLYGYLYKNCRDESVTSEMFQDVWLRVISSSGSYRREGRFRSWLFTLAHNRLVDFYRRNESSPDTEPVNDDLVAGPDAPDHGAEAREQRTRFEAVIRNLPQEQRQAFYLREECGMAVKEIAEIQSITVEAAKSRLRYAYAKLKDALRDQR